MQNASMVRSYVTDFSEAQSTVDFIELCHLLYLLDS
jgi:hypothetical protein